HRRAEPDLAAPSPRRAPTALVPPAVHRPRRAPDRGRRPGARRCPVRDRKSTRLNSSHVSISYAVFCLKKKNKTIVTNDGADEKDLDDAISVNKLDNGNHQLEVYIADIS